MNIINLDKSIDLEIFKYELRPTYEDLNLDQFYELLINTLLRDAINYKYFRINNSPYDGVSIVRAVYIKSPFYY